jgi:DNA phosphorothioation-dependent restriction protein DptG
MVDMIMEIENGDTEDSEHDELWKIKHKVAQGYSSEDAWYMENDDRQSSERWAEEKLGKRTHKGFVDKVFGSVDEIKNLGASIETTSDQNVIARNFTQIVMGERPDADLKAARDAMAGSPRLVDSFRRRGRRI